MERDLTCDPVCRGSSFVNFLIPFLKQREYKLSRQGFGEEADFQDL